MALILGEKDDSYVQFFIQLLNTCIAYETRHFNTNKTYYTKHTPAKYPLVVHSLSAWNHFHPDPTIHAKFRSHFQNLTERENK